MNKAVSLIGFGEAGQTFCKAGNWGNDAIVFDLKSLPHSPKNSWYSQPKALGVIVSESAFAMAAQNLPVLSLVTADESINAAHACLEGLSAGQLYMDGNSVSPETKRTTAALMAAKGVYYTDVAIMAPVWPAALNVPLLLSGPHSPSALETLRRLGFNNIKIISEHIGDAAAIKMVRSIMIKGMEALSAEFALAGLRAGVLEEALNSLGGDWRDKITYNLGRMLEHGGRRADEMTHVCNMLAELGLEPRITGGTVQHQRNIGMIGSKANADSTNIANSHANSLQTMLAHINAGYEGMYEDNAVKEHKG